MDRLYTISEVADKLGLSSKALRRWEETGKFVGNRTLGGQRRYSLTDLQILDAIKHGTIPSSQDLLTIEQVASLFGVSPTTITRWEEEGKIHPLITAGHTYYPRHRLITKMEELKKLPAYESPSFDAISITEEKPTPTPAPLTRPISTPLHPIPPQLSPIPLTLSLNLVSTIIIVAIYHIALAKSSAPTTPLPPQGSVQGLVTERDPSLAILDSILDKTGHIHPTSISTSSLAFIPATPPTHPAPGSVYFDSGTQSLKLYTTSWIDLTTTQEFLLKGTSALSSTGTFLRNTSSHHVDNPIVTKDTQIILTFTSDYAPAKKYWITKQEGGFTIHTDFPLSNNATFDYMILTESQEETTDAATTTTSSPSIVDSIIR